MSLFFWFISPAQARWGAEATGSALLGGFSSTSISDNSTYYAELAPGNSTKWGSLWRFKLVGAGLTANEKTDTTETAFSSTLLGGAAEWISKSYQWFGVGFSYFPSAVVTETTTSQSTYRTGAGWNGYFSFYMDLTPQWQAGFRITYLSLDLTTKSIDGAAKTVDTYQRAFVLPCATVNWNY